MIEKMYYAKMDNKMAKLSNDTVQSLTNEIMKLEAKLGDYEKALKEYADMSNWFVCYLRNHFIFKKDNYKANELAKETLKKWEKENG